MDINVPNVGALAQVHVWNLDNGTTAWVDAEADWFILQKTLGGSADIDTIVPIDGAPIAGFPDARWQRSTRTL